MPPFLQLELFADHVALLNLGRHALAEFDIEGAVAHLEAVVALSPSNRDARAALEQAQQLRDAIEQRIARGIPVEEALVQVLPDVADAVRPGLCRRIAREGERMGARAARVGDEPTGWYWFAGGAYVEAEASLRATLATYPADARARAYLADVLFVRGEVDAARVEYLRALVDDALRVARARVADPAVEALFGLADDLDVTGDCAQWTAAVGIVTGVFRVEPELGEVGPLVGAHEARGPAQQFLEALLQEQRCRTLDERIPWRRIMRQLCPALLATHLRRSR